MYNQKPHLFHGPRVTRAVSINNAPVTHRPLKGLGKIDDSDDLSEVVPTVHFVPIDKSPYPPQEYDIPEIVVSGTRIPWWVWGLAGVMGFAALNHFVKR